MTSDSTAHALQARVQTAIENKTPLYIQGGNSKLFFGNPVDTDLLLDVNAHSGIVSYEPSELCVTVKAGTLLTDLEAVLKKHRQILPFEPPVFTEAATIGGTVATGLSGPRRAYSGSVRDAILGVKIINGYGKIVSFGGQVMKNVAGYDVSRLMTGSFGTLGVILEVSLRLIPEPEANATVMLPTSQEEAIHYFAELRRSGLPVSATCHTDDDEIYIRLSSSENSIKSLLSRHGWETLNNADEFWESIRNQTHPFFTKTDKPLWRISAPPASAPSRQLERHQLLEWGGALRWIASNAPANVIHGVARKRGGEAVLFRGEVAGTNPFPTPEPALFNMHRQLKARLDPHGIFNPGRMYPSL